MSLPVAQWSVVGHLFATTLNTSRATKNNLYNSKIFSIIQQDSQARSTSLAQQS